jgi:hypothetical protein
MNPDTPTTGNKYVDLVLLTLGAINALLTVVASIIAMFPGGKDSKAYSASVVVGTNVVKVLAFFKRIIAKGPPAAVLVLCFACTALTGCPSAWPVITDVLMYVEDAARILDIVRSSVNQYFAVTPNPAVQAKIEAAIGNTSLALDTLLRVGRGAKALDSKDSIAAFAQFRAAYEDLEALLKSAGVVGPDGKMGVGAGQRMAFPRPLALMR